MALNGSEKKVGGRGRKFVTGAAFAAGLAGSAAAEDFDTCGRRVMNTSEMAQQTRIVSENCVPNGGSRREWRTDGLRVIPKTSSGNAEKDQKCEAALTRSMNIVIERCGDKYQVTSQR